MLDRRDFLKRSAVLAGTPLLPFRFAEALHRQGLPSLRETVVINALGGIANPNLRTPGDAAAGLGTDPSDLKRELDRRALQDVVNSGTSALNLTLGYVAGPFDPFEYTIQEIGRWDAIVRRYPEVLLKVWTAADIETAKQSGRTGIIFGFQNSAMVGERAERVDTFADLGVRIIQLTYNVRNQVGDGSMETENRGLTPFGFEVLERLHGARVLADLSHSGERTCLDAIRASSGPIAITHTGCRAVTDLPRNKTDEELRLLADKGGVAGIYFMPFLHPQGQARAEDVVRHVEHALNVCGEDHVGIGTDGGTTQVDDMEAYRAVIREEIRQRAAAGIGAQGESADVVPMIPDLQGPDQFRKLAGLLRQRGHSWAVVEKVLGANFLRLFGEVWGG
ncbi:MAG: membrane dipeptidase [Gemmatimonadota bacterium]